MSTKFYTVSNPTHYTPFAKQGNWTHGTGSVTSLDIEPMGGGTAYPYTQVPNSPAPPQKPILWWAASRPLLPQTISGTVNLIITGQGVVAHNEHTRIHIWIVNATTNTVHGTLLNQFEDITGTAWYGGYPGIALSSAQTLTPCTIPSDSNTYRLVIELGVIANVAAGVLIQPSTVTGCIQRGSYTVMPDLVVGGNGIDNAMTITFSHNFLLPALPVQPNRIKSGAIDLGSTPINQTINTLGDRYLWYKFFSPTDATYSAQGCNTTPREVWIDIFVEPDSIPSRGTYNKSSLIFPAKTNNTVYFLVATPTNPTGDPITFDVIKAPDAAKIGDVLVISDNTGDNYYDPTFPGSGYATWFDPIDGHVTRCTHKFIASELGVSLANGKLGIADQVGTDAGEYRLFIYDKVPGLAELRRIIIPDHPHVLGTDFVSFYCGTSGVPSGKTTVWKVSEDGVISPTTWELPASQLGYVSGGGDTSIGITRDGTILYYGHSVSGGSLRRHNLLTNTEILPAFAPPAGGPYTAGEVIVMKDNSIVCLFLKNQDHRLVHYSPSGTILRVISYIGPGLNLHHVAHNSVYDMKVWIFHNQSVSPFGNRFQLINLETGIIEIDFTSLYADVSPPAGSCVLPARFDCAGSCPLMVMMRPFNPETGEPATPGGIYELVPGKRQDTIFLDASGLLVEDVAIPNPLIKTALIGS